MLPCSAMPMPRRERPVALLQFPNPVLKGTATLVAHQHRSPTFDLVLITMSDGDKPVDLFVDSWPAMSIIYAKSKSY